MSSTSILVLGAGELGNAVIDALTSHSKRGSDVAIAVLLRSSTIHSQDAQKKSQNERLLSLGMTLEAGDIESASVAELAQILGKYHTIVSCTGSKYYEEQSPCRFMT
jgi:saccharopine dehydrogenase-like NADP-dependent oxidoreductase